MGVCSLPLKSDFLISNVSENQQLLIDIIINEVIFLILYYLGY